MECRYTWVLTLTRLITFATLTHQLTPLVLYTFNIVLQHNKGDDKPSCCYNTLDYSHMLNIGLEQLRILAVINSYPEVRIFNLSKLNFEYLLSNIFFLIYSMCGMGSMPSHCSLSGQHLQSLESYNICMMRCEWHLRLLSLNHI